MAAESEQLVRKESALPAMRNTALQGVDYDRVAKVATRVRLRNVRLAVVHGRSEGDLTQVPADWGDQAFLGFDSVVRQVNDETGDLHVRCSFLCVFQPGHDPAEGLPAFDESDPPPIDLEAEFDLTYALSQWDDLGQDDLNHFAVANATHNAWPYWRELAQNFSVRVGVPPLVVGPFKMPSAHDPDPG